MREHCECGHPRAYHNNDGCHMDPDWCECSFFEECPGPRQALLDNAELWCSECIRWLLDLVDEAGG